ncbi:HigA family addiction module antitoxin [Pseudoduganella violaceinigra]|uniref:HigA family addiction module antitoxin n=1 Tax=Pseudoduganella violaceinigra TaxID=246602 RepID=UPI0005586D65|nr:HigA family addiction module antitoxin [Pseudoduganella violaceinigra]
MENTMRPIHPGEVLLEEFMDPMGLTASTLAGVLHLEPECVTGIVRQERGISPATALQLASYFETTPEFWLDLQSAYDTRRALLKRRRVLKRTLH